ncbi:MAG: nucleoside deaminase [Campylobacterales bacterium]|nr:nucleoside deaminase [Campylobacterales bacterium]
MADQPQSLTLHLPAWITHYMQTVDTLEHPIERMRFVLGAAQRNIAHGGGPFAAAVFEAHSGTLISLGVNLVVQEGLSTLHAEMVALMLAQRIVGSYNLTAHGEYQLISSCEPCAMCLGALPWSGIRSLICAAQDADARAAGFDEGDKPPHWQQNLQSRGIEVVESLLRAEAADQLRRYSDQGALRYNGGVA